MKDLISPISYFSLNSGRWNPYGWRFNKFSARCFSEKQIEYIFHHFWVHIIHSHPENSISRPSYFTENKIKLELGHDCIHRTKKYEKIKVVTSRKANKSQLSLKHVALLSKKISITKDESKRQKGNLLSENIHLSILKFMFIFPEKEENFSY